MNARGHPPCPAIGEQGDVPRRPLQRSRISDSWIGLQTDTDGGGFLDIGHGETFATRILAYEATSAMLSVDGICVIRENGRATQGGCRGRAVSRKDRDLPAFASRS